MHPNRGLNRRTRRRWQATIQDTFEQRGVEVSLVQNIGLDKRPTDRISKLEVAPQRIKRHLAFTNLLHDVAGVVSLGLHLEHPIRHRRKCALHVERA